MPDEMFFSKDERSLRRGKRVAQRTATCRPCLIKPKDRSAEAIEGVVLDITPFGLLVRAVEPIPRETHVSIQLMRDDTFQEPFSKLLEGTVVRHERGVGAFVDHGIRLKVKDLGHDERRFIPAPRRRTALPTRSVRSRMQTVDFLLGGDRRQRR